MNRPVSNRKRLACAAAIFGLAVCGLWAAEGPVPEADLQKIRQAAPQAPRVRPLKHRKVLVFSVSPGFTHESIPWGIAALKIMGEKSGAYTATISDDPASFEKESLAQYDAVVFNNNCGLPLQKARHRENLLQFIREGKGFIGIHCASYMEWPEYLEMIGALAVNHPWNADQMVTLKVEEPHHPVARSLGGTSIVLNDEIYQFDPKYTRDKLRVLLSLDTDKTDTNRPNILRKDNDFFLAWVKMYGKGRVFYSALGHNKHIYWDERVLGHFLAGIQFALGDLQVPVEPRQ